MSASRWAKQYRVMEGDFGGKWSFDYFPWLEEMHDSQSEYNVGQKSAQVGYSEAMINVALFNLDIPKRHVLYILPNQRPDAADFAARALTPAINLSPHIRNMFDGSTNNVGHKSAGNTNLYIRGSNSESNLKSIPAGVIIFDEYEEHNQDNTKLAEERSSGQIYRLNWKISTPFAPGLGINAEYERSTKEQFFFKCPACSRMITLRFPDSLVVTTDDADSKDIFNSYLICTECKAILPHEGKKDMYRTNEWVPQRPGQLMRGFNINQLYSCALPPWKIARLWLESNKSVTAEQEFYNSKMGLPHLVAGAQITDEMFDHLIKSYQMVDSCRPGQVITLGCDVGKKLHVEVDLWDLSQANPLDWNSKAKPKVLWAGELDTFEQLSTAMVSYNVSFGVVDAQPETREATRFANEHWGKVRICRYNSNATARSVFADEEGIHLSVNRTAWLDQSLGRFRNKGIYLPSNLPRDYVKHMKVPMRMPVKDAQGNTVYRYVTQDGVHDHYAHARNYAEIALPFAVSDKKFTTIS